MHLVNLRSEKKNVYIFISFNKFFDILKILWPTKADCQNDNNNNNKKNQTEHPPNHFFSPQN